MPLLAGVRWATLSVVVMLVAFVGVGLLAAVLRGGSAAAEGPHGAWRVLGPDAIEIETEVGDHSFAIHTGYRADAATGVEEAAAGSRPAAPSRGVERAGLRPIELATASIRIAGGGGCPCCP